MAERRKIEEAEAHAEVRNMKNTMTKEKTELSFTCVLKENMLKSAIISNFICFFFLVYNVTTLRIETIKVTEGTISIILFIFNTKKFSPRNLSTHAIPAA